MEGRQTQCHYHKAQAAWLAKVIDLAFRAKHIVTKNLCNFFLFITRPNLRISSQKLGCFWMITFWE